MSGYLERFSGILERYTEAFNEAEKKRKPGSGLFGFGQRPGDYPCHEEMDRQVAELTAEAAEEAGTAETAALVKAILAAEQERKWPEAARLAVLAQQRHVMPLIPKLSAADREAIRTWYEEAYPRRKRLPIQKQLVKQMQNG